MQRVKNKLLCVIDIILYIMKEKTKKKFNKDKI